MIVNTLRIPWLASAILTLSSAGAQLPSSVDVSLDHDPANQVLRVRFRANDFSFGMLLSSVVYTIRWPEASTATLGFGSSAWCPSPSVAFPITPSSMQAPGTGYRYRTWTSIALVALSDLFDDGGCEQSLPANEWVAVHEIPVSNDPGGTGFELSDDQWTIDSNRAYYISLNGVESTGSIFTSSTAADAQQADEPLLTIQPNPASSQISITGMDGSEGGWQLEITDAAGRSALRAAGHRTPVSADVSGLPPGAYSIAISAIGSSRSARLIIAR